MSLAAFLAAGFAFEARACGEGARRAGDRRRLVAGIGGHWRALAGIGGRGGGGDFGEIRGRSFRHACWAWGVAFVGRSGFACRRADEPTSRRADEPTSRRADEPTSRRADEPTSRRADEPTSRRADEPTSRRADEPTSRRADTRTDQPFRRSMNRFPCRRCRAADSPTRRFTDLPIYRFTDLPIRQRMPRGGAAAQRRGAFDHRLPRSYHPDTTAARRRPAVRSRTAAPPYPPRIAPHRRPFPRSSPPS
ncbi:putative sR protein factor [Burkholderia pseudomallei PB08298010]|nr:putative sR protein factor [Burkholderia pseudomallei PB08298010]